jgi:1-aminocyclopropane-1-carboxylate deaminase/D-cysteine desulfhydrase-like pyridoxal-dependent ACC family enzyme
VQPLAINTLDIDRTTVQRRLAALPHVQLGAYPTQLDDMPRLRAALGGGPRLLVKRDDLISFGCGGNKVRKIELLAARALAEGADTLVSTGGVQSNHARVTAAVAARLGMDCVIVVNGSRQPAGPTGNARLMQLFGARVEYVATREERPRRMADIAAELRLNGRRPFIVPLGASTGLGALGFVRAIGELLTQGPPPDAILVASSSGGTQAGLVGGCAVFGAETRVLGISADDPAADIAQVARGLLRESGDLLGLGEALHDLAPMIQVDEGFIGGGYATPTKASLEAATLVARTEGIVLDPVYTAKAMAGLIAYVRDGRFSPEQTVVFWHTGGVPGFFA